MRKAAFLLFLGLTSFFGTEAKDIQAYMRNCVFLSVKDTAYVETQLIIESKTLLFVKGKDKQLRSTVEVTILYMQDTTVKEFFKYLLGSPGIKDTANFSYDLTDLKRTSLPNGNYTVEVYLKDVNDSSTAIFLTEDISIDYDNSSLAFSDIELVESYEETKQTNIYSKHGYDIRPYVIPLYVTGIDQLTFYAEVYNTKPIFGEAPFLFAYSIREVWNNKTTRALSFLSKQTAEKLKITFSTLDISSLPTGNYFLTIEVRDKENKVIAEKSILFRRVNKNIVFGPEKLHGIHPDSSFVSGINKDSLNFYVYSLSPIAGNEELDYISFLKKSNDTVAVTNFLYIFWKQRNPEHPLEEWKRYLAQVYVAEENYRSPNKHGFQTDRGRVLLQYGPPNSVVGSDREPGALPYEIWHYYVIPTGQTNIKFVFYNPVLASNDYSLIHSEALGEVKDSQWKYKVLDSFKYKNGYRNIDSNGSEIENSFGTRLSDYFDE